MRAPANLTDGQAAWLHAAMSHRADRKDIATNHGRALFRGQCGQMNGTAPAMERVTVAMLAATVLFLAFPIAVDASTAPWFAPASSQKISSKTTAPPADDVSLLERLFAKKLQGEEVYEPPAGLQLPYPKIRDNTLGAGAYADVLELLPSTAAPGRPKRLLLDVGAGRSDAAKRFVEAAKPGWRVVVADPYNRSEAENANAQREVEKAGGADAVASMSVLNVIAEQDSRAEHISLVRRALRPGGIAIFKVWAGLWPERGTGAPSMDASGDSFQANAWASTFLPDIEAEFGKGNAYADNNLNLIVAQCPH
eukprot:CAMPEP_0179028872 /NCGR_PEP_ID=MMETSP0796-20121207/9764_1 /TAXON_ID=73915 /ORGANISM="Pyrodinium bahamense, Strain pbaha01" /LENGTH=308 /DNA_ID=CAMNT_0020725017 /DNA_START=101 /DNA_END=1027 /DNA_ORIENTATION=+